MAIYHLHAQIIGRSEGRSSVGAAAYRLGLELKDELTGEIYDYTRKQGVSAWTTLAPAGAPEWVHDPAKLWNAVEAGEKRADAQLCRELDIALPAELTDEAKKSLLLGFVQSEMVDRGMVAQVAFHDLGSHNPHAHVMLTMRDIGPEGFDKKKNRAWNAKELLEGWREQWATQANASLEAAGQTARIDHRTLEAQQLAAVAREDFAAAAVLDRAPTAHEGPATTQARKEGHALPRAERNDRVGEDAAQRLAEHIARFDALKGQAQAAGRLTPVDEQAAHARALLERTQEGRARLREAATQHPTPRSPRNGQHSRQRGLGAPLTRASRYRPGDGNNGHAHGLGALPAVRPLNPSSACQRPDRNTGGPETRPAGAGGLLRSHESGHPGPGSSLQRLRAQRGAGRAVARAPTVPSAGGPGPSQGKHDDRRAELVASFQAAQTADEAIRALLAVARHALQRSDSLNPWQRSCARGVLETHQAEAQAVQSHLDAAAKRQRARQRVEVARADAGAHPVPTDLASRAGRAVGLPTQQDKDATAAQEALAQAMRRAARAKEAREAKGLERQAAVAAAEKARADFAGAFDLPFPRFAAQPTDATSKTTSQPALIPKPGPDAPRPRFARPR